MVHALWQVSILQPRTAEIEFTDESIQRCLGLCDAFLTFHCLPQVSTPDDPCGLALPCVRKKGAAMRAQQEPMLPLVLTDRFQTGPKGHQTSRCREHLMPI